MKKCIFWISSYPKSGNTLIRAILSSLFFSKDGKFNFDTIKHISSFELSQRLNFIKKLSANDFNNLEDIRVLSKYWQIMQTEDNLRTNNNIIFLKTHSALMSVNQRYFTSPDLTSGYVYIVRDPRDVCISWAAHSNTSIDESINFLTNKLATIPWQNIGSQSQIPKNIKPRILLSSWGEHVKSWTNNNWNTPNLVIRYEDIIENKEKIIIDINNFLKSNLNIRVDNFKIKLSNILQTTSFEYLQNLEQKKTFSESKPWTPFFRKGSKNQWLSKLNKNQIKKIENAFKDYMIKFDYKLSL